MFIPEVVLVTALAVRVDTAAEMAQVSRATIYSWIRSGKLKTVPVGADQRILVEEFNEFLRSRGGAGTVASVSRARLSK